MSGLIGAGRTNVARALFGTEPATSGTIKPGGKVVVIKSRAGSNGQDRGQHTLAGILGSLLRAAHDWR